MTVHVSPASGPSSLSYYDEKFGDFRYPNDAAAVAAAVQAAGLGDNALIGQLLKMVADRDLTLEDYLTGANIPNVQQDVGIFGTPTTVATDLASWTVQDPNGNPWPFTTLQQPVVTVGINCGDSVAWDMSLEVRSAPGGGGTQLGLWGMRNPCLGAIVPFRVAAVINCDEYFVDPDTLQTYYLHCYFSNGTPTTGINSEGGSRCDRWVRTRVRRYMGPI